MVRTTRFGTPLVLTFDFTVVSTEVVRQKLRSSKGLSELSPISELVCGIVTPLLAVALERVQPNKPRCVNAGGVTPPLDCDYTFWQAIAVEFILLLEEEGLTLVNDFRLSRIAIDIDVVKLRMAAT